MRAGCTKSIQLQLLGLGLNKTEDIILIRKVINGRVRESITCMLLRKISWAFGKWP